MAPVQSLDELFHAPSTQFPPWTTVSVTLLVGKFDDSNVPVHTPARLTTGPVPFPDGVVGAGDDPHALAAASTTSQDTNLRMTL
jgi:hypothetical protein